MQGINGNLGNIAAVRNDRSLNNPDRTEAIDNIVVRLESSKSTKSAEG